MNANIIELSLCTTSNKMKKMCDNMTEKINDFDEGNEIHDELSQYDTNHEDENGTRNTDVRRSEMFRRPKSTQVDIEEIWKSGGYATANKLSQLQ